ncbi:MAG: phosphoribosylglycinamide formyltransferase, partial [Pseudomonadota bacterium]
MTPEPKRVRTGVLISGRGSNLQALIDACEDPESPAEIGLVLSNDPDAKGLARAAKAGIETAVVGHRDYPDRPSFERAMSRRLEEAGVQLVCLAGFMRLLTETFVDHWFDRLINIHPSLLPAFKGLDTHARVITAGARFTGATVHFVRAAMDDGPIIIQAAVPVLPDDDEESLAARVLAAEHRIYPAALNLVAAGRTRVTDDRVEIDRYQAPAEFLMNPLENP